ncbi:MAG: hypothetical protein WDN28_16400 [Chthoniobacter sp.]
MRGRGGSVSGGEQDAANAARLEDGAQAGGRHAAGAQGEFIEPVAEMLGAGAGMIAPRAEQRDRFAIRMRPNEGQVFAVAGRPPLAEGFHYGSQCRIGAVAEFLRGGADLLGQFGRDASLGTQGAGNRHLGDAAGFGHIVQGVGGGAGHREKVTVTWIANGSGEEDRL